MVSESFDESCEPREPSYVALGWNRPPKVVAQLMSTPATAGVIDFERRSAPVGRGNGACGRLVTVAPRILSASSGN